jgi:hypothetical protein
MGRPIGRSLLTGGLAAGLGLILILSLLPAPSPATLLTQVVVVHNSLSPAQTSLPDLLRPPIPPELLATLTSTLDGRQVDSWLYRAGRDRISVHRVQGVAQPPRNAAKLAIADRPGHAFELGDLGVLSWSDDDGITHLVVGDAPVHRLRDLAVWVRTRK